MDRSSLAILVCALALLGAALLSVPFASSLEPSARANASRPHLPIANLSRGQYKLFRNIVGAVGGSAFLVYRPVEGSIKVWRIPTYNHYYVMPDMRWGRYGALCKNFGLDSAHTTFRCLEPESKNSNENEWLQRECVWDLSGRNLGTHTEDMVAIVGEEDEHYFVIGTSRK